MQEYFFANYRLLIDEKIAERKEMQYLEAFQNPMPYTHTFTIHLGDSALWEEKYEKAISCPEVCTTDDFAIHDENDIWSLTYELKRYNWKYVACYFRDYSELTVYIPDNNFYNEEYQTWREPHLPSNLIRVPCEAGMVMRDGMPLHASLVEKDGYGVIFLGPSGMGKSTQAKLWEKYQNADFVIGDRPGLRCIDGVWYGFGMPWDGKDGIRRQKAVPIKALVSLEQAKENKIVKLSEQQAMIVLLNQVMMPMWDDKAMESVTELMGKLVKDIPFYHLKNLPNEGATVLTYETIFGGDN